MRLLKYTYCLIVCKMILFLLSLVARCPGKSIDDTLQLIQWEKRCHHLHDTARNEIEMLCYNSPKTWETFYAIKQVILNLEHDCNLEHGIGSDT